MFIIVDVRSNNGMKGPYMPQQIVPSPLSHTHREMRVLFDWVRSKGGNIQYAKQFVRLLNTCWMSRLP